MNMRPSSRPTIATTKVITIIDPIENTSLLDLRVGVTKIRPRVVGVDRLTDFAWLDCQSTRRCRQPKATEIEHQTQTRFCTERASSLHFVNIDSRDTHVRSSRAKPLRYGCIVNTFNISRSRLARLLHYGFFGSGSFFFVKAKKSGIETRQYLDCCFLSGNQGRNYKSYYSLQAGLLISRPACCIFEHIKKAHVFQN